MLVQCGMTAFKKAGSKLMTSATKSKILIENGHFSSVTNEFAYIVQVIVLDYVFVSL